MLGRSRIDAELHELAEAINVTYIDTPRDFIYQGYSLEEARPLQAYAPRPSRTTGANGGIGDASDSSARSQSSLTGSLTANTPTSSSSTVTGRFGISGRPALREEELPKHLQSSFELLSPRPTSTERKRSASGRRRKYYGVEEEDEDELDDDLDELDEDEDEDWLDDDDDDGKVLDDENDEMTGRSEEGGRRGMTHKGGIMNPSGGSPDAVRLRRSVGARRAAFAVAKKRRQAEVVTRHARAKAGHQRRQEEEDDDDYDELRPFPSQGMSTTHAPHLRNGPLRRPMTTKEKNEMRERAYQERIKLLQLEKDREAHEAQERKVREEQAEEMKRRQVVEILAAKLDVAAHTAKEKNDDAGFVTLVARAISTCVPCLGSLHPLSLRFVHLLVKWLCYAAIKTPYETAFQHLQRALALTLAAQTSSIDAWAQSQSTSSSTSPTTTDTIRSAATARPYPSASSPSLISSTLGQSTRRPRPASASVQGRPVFPAYLASTSSPSSSSSSSSSRPQSASLTSSISRPSTSFSSSRPPSASLNGKPTARPASASIRSRSSLFVNSSLPPPKPSLSQQTKEGSDLCMAALASLRLFTLNILAVHARQAGDLRTSLSALQETISIYGALDRREAELMTGMSDTLGNDPIRQNPQEILMLAGIVGGDTTINDSTLDSSSPSSSTASSSTSPQHGSASLHTFVADLQRGSFLNRVEAWRRRLHMLPINDHTSSPDANTSQTTVPSLHAPFAYRRDGKAVAMLNLCAVLSELGSHHKAKSYAERATALLQRELLIIDIPRHDPRTLTIDPAQLNLPPDADPETQERARNEALSAMHAALVAEEEKQLKDRLTDKVSLLCAAYHNLAVEMEHLREFDSALAKYKDAYDLASKHLGNESDLTKTMKETYDVATVQIARRREVDEKRGRLTRRSHSGAQSLHSSSPSASSRAQDVNKSNIYTPSKSASKSTYNSSSSLRVPNGSPNGNGRRRQRPWQQNMLFGSKPR